MLLAYKCPLELLSASSLPNPWRKNKPVGFYKRGCQVKTLLLSREEEMFF
jgi:hypothetical protein